jgi:acyl carrier protein
MTMTNEPIADADVPQMVCQIVAEALAREPNEIQVGHNLMEDLGAESLDFLDIVFKLEQTFGIEITRGALEEAAKGDMSDDEFAPKGVISDAGLDRLRTLLPESADRITTGLRAAEIPRLFVVQTFVTIALTARARKLQA